MICRRAGAMHTGSMVSADRDRPRPLLQQRAFAALWVAWMAVHLCVWMADVAASWLMTSLTDSKFMVAMVQTCAALPIFLFSLPGGALADRINRRDGFLIAQLWASAVLASMGALAWTGSLSPLLLLALVSATSLATALRWPVYSALVPEVVPRESLSQALAFNSIAMNLSRLLGPLLAGVLVAAWGGASVYAVCVALTLTSAGIVALSIRRSAPRPIRHEPWLQAMRAGPALIRRDPWLAANWVRGVSLFFTVTALLGLLPSLARELGSGGPQVYATLFAGMGAGAVVAGFGVQAWRRRLGSQGLFNAGAVVLGLCILLVAWTRQVWLATLAMCLVGAAWMGVGNTLNTLAQMRLPDALRARGMSVYFMGGMAGGAAGAACLGALADGIGLRPALGALGVVVLTANAWAWRRLPLSEDRA